MTPRTEKPFRDIGILTRHTASAQAIPNCVRAGGSIDLGDDMREVQANSVLLK